MADGDPDGGHAVDDACPGERTSLGEDDESARNADPGGRSRAEDRTTRTRRRGR